ncbi:hypothetical protein NQ317_005089, partial [Molorchus minor]
KTGRYYEFRRKKSPVDSKVVGTAKVLKFLDNLFDSCNGHTLFPKSGKDLKCSISSTSKHNKFWIEARHNLSNM